MDNQNYNQYQPTNYEEPVSVLNWIGTMIVTCIPVVNIIMLIIWAVSHKNQTKKNWAIAQIVIIVIGIVLSFVFSAAVVSMFAGLANM